MDAVVCIVFIASIQCLLCWFLRVNISDMTPFNIPHSLSLLDDDQLLCVADREHGRVLCYNSTTGQLVFDDTPSSFGGRVFAFIFSKGKSLWTTIVCICLFAANSHCCFAYSEVRFVYAYFDVVTTTEVNREFWVVSGSLNFFFWGFVETAWSA